MIAENKKNRNFRRHRSFFSTIFGLVIIGAVVFLAASNIKINQKRAELIEKRKALEEEVQALEERKSQLNLQISEVETEEFLEKEIRESFDLKKPGEEVVVVLPPEEKEESSREEEKSLWEKIKEKLNL